MEHYTAEFQMGFWQRIKVACLIWWAIVWTGKISCFESESGGEDGSV